MEKPNTRVDKPRESANDNNKPSFKQQPSVKPKSSPGQFKKSTHVQSMVEKSSAYSYSCIFCKEEHTARMCTKYPTRNQRLERLKSLNRCIKCCRQHSEDNCPNKITPCYHCGAQHHTWLCVGTPTHKGSKATVAPL